MDVLNGYYRAGAVQTSALARMMASGKPCSAVLSRPMKQWDRKAKMDEMETLELEGWHLLCGGEQLPSGAFQATFRYTAPPSGYIRTLVLDPEKFDTARQALERSEELAMKWANVRSGDGRGDA